MFWENVTPAVKKGEAVCLIDVDGKVVADLKKLSGKTVARVNNFSDGVAVFETIDGCYGAINTAGKVVIEPKYVSLNNCVDGKLVGIDKKYEAAVKASETEKVKACVLDRSGKIVSELSGSKFKDMSGYFVDGLMAVTVRSGDEEHAGLIDEKGEWKVRPTSRCRKIKEIRGDKFVYDDGDKQGLMNLKGEVLIRAKYDYLNYLGDGVLAAGDYDSDEGTSFSMIKESGEKIGTEEFKSIYAFLGKGEYAVVRLGDHEYGFVDTDGELLKTKGPDFYDIEFNAGDFYVESDYVDFQAIVEGLRLTKKGMDGFTVGMSPENAVKAVNAIKGETAAPEAEDYTYRNSLYYTKDFKVCSGEFAVTFDGYIGQRITETVYDYYYSYDKTVGYKFSTSSSLASVSAGFKNYGKLEGKMPQLYAAVVSKLKTLGRVAKSSEHAAILDLGGDVLATVYYTKENVAIFIARGTSENIENTDFESFENREWGSSSSADVADDSVWDTDSLAADSAVVASDVVEGDSATGVW